MPPSHSSLSDTDEGREGRYLRESIASVRLHAQRLRRALDADRLDEAVKIAADVAAELRSNAASELSPKLYYDVYLSVGAELRVLENYAMESARRGAPVLELYERVQETPLVLPRLYLLITAGSVYIKSQQAAPKDVLEDLVEMCAGVQHPQRGLFLRAYLSQMMKDKLPCTKLDEEGDVEEVNAGNVHDSISFVIRNFTEMNRLWVRMQREVSARDIELLEKERLELRILVGSNIATLGRLVGSNLHLYQKEILPAVVEQIVKCNDSIAQEYLADCLAQVFPDEFHLQTLEAFMSMCKDLRKGVNIASFCHLSSRD
ncbi:Vacuolar protein sorting-associated protein [Gracilaria domingensis]|nr:Vacuolar protein sorting-associated protein [Gracilaria domingensis]